MAKTTSTGGERTATEMLMQDHRRVQKLFKDFEKVDRDDDEAVRELVETACLELQIHSMLEEEIFYPALGRVIGPNPLLDKSVPEHAQMRAMIATLRTLPPEGAIYDDSFRMLMREVLHHVADEETIILPLAEEVLDEELGELGVQMMKRRLQLLAPHVKQITTTSAQSFPVLTGGAIATMLWFTWRLMRPSEKDGATGMGFARG